MLILPKQVAGVNLVGHVLQVFGYAVGHDHVGFFDELLQIVDHTRVEEVGLFEHGLVNDDFHTLGLDALHDALDAAGAEVVGAGFHDQAVDADHWGLGLPRRFAPRNDGP